MPTATVTVDYINPPKPGGKMGSIKTKEIGYVNVYPDKLFQFTPGQTYTIDYDIKSSPDGTRQFKNFKSIVGGAPMSQPKVYAAKPPSGNSTAQEMFVMGFINRLWQGFGGIPEQAELTEAGRRARHAWNDIWADPPKTGVVSSAIQRQEELDDEIPF